MYNDLKVFSGSAHPELARAICAQLGLPLGCSNLVRFANENILVQIEENVRGADVFVIQPSCSPVSDGIIELLITIDTLKHASARRITAVIPYFPYARSDKQDKPRISIAARLMAALLETAGAHRILTLDLHSPQVQGFFRIPVDHIFAAPIICDYLVAHRNLRNYLLVACDIGGAKHVGRYSHLLNLPMAIVDKRRYGDGEMVKATHLMGEVAGKVALIVDDEIASAGTVIEAARLASERGAIAVEAVATHGVLSGCAIARLLSSPIRSVLVTDSLPISQAKRIHKLTVLSVASIFAEAIKAIHIGESVSPLDFS
jgi:ribose-phosphate pyrophosphokinase